MKSKTILLTFDIEEADVINNYDNVSKEQEFEISKKGLISILKLLEKYNLKATFFVTFDFARKYPRLIKNMQKQGHEIACHGYSHLDNYLKNETFHKIKQAKEQIEKIINSEITGFRAPRFQIKNISKLSELGFLYDSSIHPTWIPTKYCNLLKKRKIHKIQNIIEVPLSTLPFFPFLRAPINWIVFRNFSNIYRKSFLKINFLFSNYLMLIFHPWEFTNLLKFKLPRLIKRNSGEKLIKILEEYIIFAKKKNYGFETISDFLKQKVSKED